MIRKMAALWLSMIIAIGSILLIVEIAPIIKSSEIIYVDDVAGVGPGNPSENFTSIQDAINSSSNGDTIYVYNGTYYENVVVNKTINLTGENRETTIIEGANNNDVVIITSDWVNLTGFTITNSGPSTDDAGIQIDSDYNSVFHNNIYYNYYGVYLNFSDGNNSYNNTLVSNDYGIFSQSSVNNIIYHNNFLDNTNSAYDEGTNQWNIGYPAGGNYWDNWTMPDDDEDGFVDTPFLIPGGSGQDDYPFSNIWGWDLGGCWHLDEGFGVYANDSSGNDNNGTLGPAYPSNAPQWVNGISNDALEFDGIDDFIDCQNKSSLNITDAITIEAWVKLNSLQPGIITSKPGAYYLEINYDNKLVGGIHDSDNWYRVLGTTILSVDRWYHVMFTYDGHNLTLYLDGVLEGESTHNGSISPLLINNFYVGKQIFIDDYSSYIEGSDGSQTYDFEIYGGGQVVENGAYHFYGNTGDEPISIIRGFNASDMIIEARVMKTSPAGGAYFCPRFLTVEDKFEIVLDMEWNQVVLNKVVGNVWAQINSADLGYTVQIGTWYTLKGQITTEGSINRIKIWVNDVLYINDTDPDLMDYTMLAILAFDYENPFDIHFDDLKVYIPFNGTIDEIRVWDRALTPIEVREQYRRIITDSIFLYNGWNLISTPYILSDTDLGPVLSSISGYYDAVQWFDTTDSSDPWKHNHTLKPQYMNDFRFISNTKGFWIHITEPGGVLFEYTGMPPTEIQTIALHIGWNLVGYSSQTSYNRLNGLNNLTFGTHVDSVWSYSASNQKWRELGPSDHFEPGRGYWILAKEECTWEVPL
ncbi:MAG: hypothetical protein JSV56_06270 [Methanomassiliicoccales archaeon]|nr:MAG: hypothetical protein JSV56_06270 [Methanomassiliicoccales archaeon]